MRNNAVSTGKVDPDFVERFEATAHGRWLRHKFRDPNGSPARHATLCASHVGRVSSGLCKRLSRGYKLLIQRHVAPGPCLRPSVFRAFASCGDPAAMNLDAF
jgi:hypothetical protein